MNVTGLWGAGRWVVRCGLVTAGALSIIACVAIGSLVVRPGVIERAPTGLLLALVALGALPMLTYAAIRLDGRARRARALATPSLEQGVVVVASGGSRVRGVRTLRHAAHRRATGGSEHAHERQLVALLERDRHHDVHKV